MIEKQKSHSLLYSLAVVALIFACFAAYTLLTRPLKVEEFDTRYYVRESTIGFDLNTTAITFGNVFPGSGAVRQLNFSNDYPFDVKVLTYVTEEIADEVYAPQGLVIATGNVISVPVSVSIPQNATVRNYTGKVRFEVYKCGSLALMLKGEKC